MQAEARKQTSERSRARAKIPNSDRTGIAVGRVLCGRFWLQHALDHKSLTWRVTDQSNQSLVLKGGPAALVEREFQTLSALHHPNIIDAIECIDGEAGRFLVLEYLPGGDLVSLAGQPPRYWSSAVMDVIDALRYLHHQGVVHRDLKARNVLFDSAGNARLIDFGSALAIGSQWSVGGTTEVAVHPERGNAPVSAHDDVYALICLLHEMLYGMPPGHGERGSVPKSAQRLAELVDSSLAALSADALPGLDQLAAGVESLQGIRRNSQ